MNANELEEKARNEGIHMSSKYQRLVEHGHASLAQVLMDSYQAYVMDVTKAAKFLELTERSKTVLLLDGKRGATNVRTGSRAK